MPSRKKQRLSEDGVHADSSPVPSPASTSNTDVPIHKKQVAVRGDGEVLKYNAGLNKNPKTFLLTSNEAVVARYTRFMDTGRFREFLLSHHFLRHFERFDCEWSANLRRDPAYVYIRDCFLQHDDKTFSDEDNEPGNQFPFDGLEGHELKLQKGKRLAQILILMVQEFKGSPKVAVDKAAQVKAIESLKSRRKNLRDDPIPSPEPHVKYPTLHTGLEGEESLEPYNRAYMILKHAQYLFNETIKKRVLSTNWNDKTEIGDHYLPLWMRSKQNSDDADSKVLSTTVPALRRIQIDLIRDKALQGGSYGDFETRQKLLVHIDDMSHNLASKITSPSGDPRTHDEHQYLDTIRDDFECSSLRIEPYWAMMTIPTERSKEKHDLFTFDWSTVREHLESSFDPADGIVVVEVRFRALD